MELIEKGSLYSELCRLEELARNRYLDTPSSSPASVRYCAQLNERTALKHLIADAPTIDAVPVVHGRWIHPEGAQSETRACTICNNQVTMDFDAATRKPLFKGCPHCFAQMDGEEADHRPLDVEALLKSLEKICRQEVAKRRSNPTRVENVADKKIVEDLRFYAMVPQSDPRRIFRFGNILNQAADHIEKQSAKISELERQIMGQKGGGRP